MSALLTVAFAYVLSGRYPVGVGATIELHRGLEFDPAVLLLAALVTFAFMVGIAFTLGRVDDRHRLGSPRGGRRGAGSAGAARRPTR